MKLNDLIKQLENMRAEYVGNIQVLMEEGQDGAIWDIINVKHEVVPSSNYYPSYYKMRKGFKFIKLAC